MSYDVVLLRWNGTFLRLTIGVSNNCITDEDAYQELRRHVKESYHRFWIHTFSKTRDIQEQK